MLLPVPAIRRQRPKSRGGHHRSAALSNRQRRDYSENWADAVTMNHDRSQGRRANRRPLLGASGTPFIPLCSHRHRADVTTGQLGLKRSAAAVVQPVHGPLGLADRLGDLRRGPAEDMAQDDDLALRVG